MAISFRKGAWFILIYGQSDLTMRLSLARWLTPLQRAIHRDSELYPGPDSFNPDRWLSPRYPTYREPLTLYPNMINFSVFGFGRRLCPGAHIAERSLNIIVARTGWACNIGKAVDPATGREITPPEYDCKWLPLVLNRAAGLRLFVMFHRSHLLTAGLHTIQTYEV